MGLMVSIVRRKKMRARCLKKSVCSVALAAGLIAGVSPAWSQASSNTAASNPVAIVGGLPISEAELLNQTRSQMQQLRNQEYEIKKQALDGLVNQMLLEAEARLQNVGAAELLMREVDSQLRETTEEEISAFYAGQKDRIGKPIEEVKDQIAQLLKQGRLQQARQNYVAKLRNKLPVEILLEPPRLNVKADPARMRGDVNAPVTIVEFSDFQCPFCLRAYPTLRAVLAKYPSKVRMSYRDFPLSTIHGQARIASEAARCAGDSGKFWEYHDMLFEKPGDLSRETLMAHAAALSLDTPAFELCLEAGKYRAAVEQDYQEGQQAGISGTPAFYINGIFLSGAQQSTAFEQIIDSELARIAKQSASASQ